MLDTPVLFIVFNRPSTTQKVFDAIRAAQPKQLFIAADGARKLKDGEEARCTEVRSITQQVDWDCEVKTLFSDENQGCGLGPFNAITWFFKHVEQGIILEDDCLPDQSFFLFCEQLLEKYKDDNTVMHITGNNFQFGKKRSNDSYYFSKYTHNWGWATWKRAWVNMDFDLKTFEHFKSNLDEYPDLFNNISETKHWINEFENISRHKNHVWDVQWLYSVWKSKGIVICPNENLITNIGVGDDATHTFEKNRINSIVGKSLKFPLIHPVSTKINKQADLFVYSICYKHNIHFAKKIINKSKRIVKKLLKGGQ